MDDTRQTKLRVAEALRAARRAKGLTQEALAAEVGCSVETLSNAERGVSLPALDLFLDLARVLNIDVSALVASDERPPPTRDRLRLEAGAVTTARQLKDEYLKLWLEMGRVFQRG